MLMDLRNTNALMFKNSGTGEFNMIYRREDGNIGWVEPRKADPSSFQRRRCDSRRPCKSSTMHLSDFLDFEAIKTALPGGSKKALLQQLANLAGQRLELEFGRHPASLTEREQLGSTGFGQGVAIPHGKIEGLSRSTACSPVFGAARLQGDRRAAGGPGLPAALAAGRRRRASQGARRDQPGNSPWRNSREDARRAQPRRARGGADGRGRAGRRLSQRRLPGPPRSRLDSPSAAAAGISRRSFERATRSADRCSCLVSAGGGISPAWSAS